MEKEDYYEVLSASSPRWANAEHSMIDLLVQFKGITYQIEFSASQNDTEAHGKELFERAQSGEFGTISEYVEPAPLSMSESEALAKRERLLSDVASRINPLEDAEKLGIATSAEEELLASLRRHRVELYRLPESAGWPSNAVWPTSPEA